MKKVIIAILIFTPIGKLFAQWEAVYYIPPNQTLPKLNATRFFNGTTGLACGQKWNPIEGVVIKTPDSGTTWDTVLVDNTTIMEKIAILNNSTAIVVGKPNSSTSSKAYKTSDSGQTWSSISFPNTNFSSIHFANQTTGFITDMNGIVFRSINSGSSWQNIALISDTLKEVFAISSNKVFIISNGNLYSSNDGGVSWGNLFFNGEFLIDITFFDNNVGYILAYAGYYSVPNDLFIYKTTDGGATWNKVSTLFSQLFHPSIYFSSADIGYIVGQFSVYHTTDGGFTWGSMSSGPPSSGNFMDDLADVFFVNVDTGYIAGNAGDFYRLTYQNNSILEINASVFQIFPNPATDEITVRFSISNKDEDVRLKLYDVSGTLIYLTSVKGENGDFSIHTNKLSSGIYLLRIEGNGGLLYSEKIAIQK